MFYDQKDAEGQWRYYRDPEVMASVHATAYVGAMDFAFETYQSLIEPMQEFYKGQKPLAEAEYDVNGDGVKEHLADLTDEGDIKAFKRTYNADIRTKACDTLRALLPIATKTHVGIMGNGRFFQWVISHCMASPIREVRDIAEQTLAELGKVIPTYVKRARASEYTIATNLGLAELARELFSGITSLPAVDRNDNNGECVDLLDRGEEFIAARCAAAPGDAGVLRTVLRDEEDTLTMACALYPYVSLPLQQIRETVRGFSSEVRTQILKTLVGERKTRRDRPARSLEAGYPYTFDMCTDFGTYKDLMRHRMSTQLRQPFTPVVGFAMPEDLVTAGFANKAQVVHERMMVLYELLKVEFPAAASYATLHGSLVRWVMGLNDRSAMHLIELRTTPQGHPSYRRVAALMHDAISARSAWRGAAMQFADHGVYGWARGDAEAKQRVKEKALDAQK